MKLLNRKIVSIMKKNYNQPTVEATELIVSGQALCTSPDPIISSGGSSSGLGGGDPLGD